MTEHEPVTGSVVHVEIYTDDKQATQDFYRKAFAWSFQDVEEMDYTMYQAPSPPHGGIMERQEGPFKPPSTFFYLKTEDIQATRDAIEAAGGQIIEEEIEVPGMGVFTVFQDPGGVVQAAWEDRYEGEPPEDGWDLPTDEAEPGSIVHFELYSDDPAATRTFYEAAFGWTFEDAEDVEYTFANPPTPPSGGLMEANEQMPAGTLPYLLAEDAQAACEAVEAAGGQVLREPFEVPSYGRMAVFQAPGGIVQAIWESAGS